jgi:hypothetical protein
MVRKGYGSPGGKQRLALELGITQVKLSKALNGFFVNAEFAAQIMLNALEYLKKKQERQI